MRRRRKEGRGVFFIAEGVAGVHASFPILTGTSPVPPKVESKSPILFDSCEYSRSSLCVVAVFRSEPGFCMLHEAVTMSGTHPTSPLLSAARGIEAYHAGTCRC